MKCIHPDNITSLSANLEDTNYPDDNLLNKSPKKCWKSTGNTGIITIASTQSSGICIAKTNAITMSISLTAGGASLELASGLELAAGLELNPDTAAADVEVNLSETAGENSVFATWSERSTSHTVVITLAAETGDILQVGAVTVGDVLLWPDPIKQYSETFQDYSIEKELNNGALYYRQRDIVREFSGTIIVNRKSDTEHDFYDFMNIYKQIGKNPIGWMMSDISGGEWVVFGRFEYIPKGVHIKDKSRINYNVIEVL